MDIRILGPIEVSVDGRNVALGGLKQRALLAHLVLRAGRIVPSEGLIDRIWGEDPPQAARNALQSYVSRLRKALGSDRIEGTPPGYVLRARPEEIDAIRFESLVAAARDVIESDPSAAAGTLQKALSLWRGPALADLATHTSLAGEVARLEELRLSATEQLMVAEIAAGRHSAVVGELEVLTQRHPLRERLWAHLMVALYRSGRQGDALSSFHRARSVLATELGIDPSRELQELHQRILAQDPSLTAVRDVVPRGSAPLSSGDLGTAGHERRPRRRASVIAAAILAVVAAAFLVRTLLPSAPRDLADLPAGIVIIDARSGDELGFVPRSVVKTPAEVIYAEGHYWVLNLDPLSFIQIDPRTGAVLRQISSPVDDVGYYTVDGDTLWVTHYTEPVLVAVDIDLGREVRRFTNLPGKGGSYGIAVADGSVWVARQEADGGTGAMVRLDPQTGDVQLKLNDLPGSTAVAYGDDGAIWTAGTHGAVNRIDPRTSAVASAHIGARNFYVAAGGGYGWTTDEARGVVHKIDRLGEIAGSYRTGEGARALWYSDGVVWVSNQDDGTVTGIEVGTGARTTYRFPHPLQAIAAGSGTVLVQLNQGLTYEDRIAALSGSVAKLLVSPYQLEPIDPALGAGPLAVQVAYATCARLVTYPDASAPEGLDLVPEVAASMPTVSPDGRTYTFVIRPGYRFSPPSNQPVTAETFRYSIERALSPDLAAGVGNAGVSARRVIGDIAGERAYLDGRVDHMWGLRAAGNILTITLVRPSRDFLARLATPFFCPVPVGTPYIPGGNALSLPGPAGRRTIPSAGPYYIADQFNGEYTILKRNPNYTGPRPHALDAIALREGVDIKEAIRRVEAGSWDGITGFLDPMLAPGGPVDRRYGAIGEDATNLRYYAVPDPPRPEYPTRGSGQGDLLSARLGCRVFPPFGLGIDLASLCFP